MKSVIGSFYTLSACMDKIPDIEIEEWEAINEKQKQYLEIYKNCRNAIISEIESKVSKGDVTPVNEFLRERGFNIELNPLENPQDLAIASVLELLLNWLEKGDKTTLYFERKEYQSVSLSYGVRILKMQGFINPVVEIKTKTGDIIYMTIPKTVPINSFEVFNLARQIISNYSFPLWDYENRVIFPMIDLDVKPDITWLEGMADKYREKWEIKQALQQTKVKMDEKGVLIKEAVAIDAVCLAAPMKFPLFIDKPFLFVVKREGLKEPLFSAYLETDSWVEK